MQEKVKSLESDYLPLRFFSLLSLTVTLSVGFFWLMEYLDYDAAKLISYWTADYPGEGMPIGQHYFGDYSLPRGYVLQGNPWFQNKFPDVYNYTPLATTMFRFFTFGNYYFSLFLFLTISCVSSLYPLIVWWKIRNQTEVESNLLTLPIKILALSGTLGSLGFISVIDRGNYVSWIVPFIFLAFYFISKKRWGAASLSIAVAASLKIYPALLFILFIRDKKWKDLAQGIVCVASLFIIPVFSIPGNILDTIQKAISNILNWQGSNFLGKEPFNISFAASLHNSARLLKLERLELFLVNHLNYISLILLLFIFLICLNNQIPLQIICFVLTSSLWVIPSLSAPYVCVVLLPAIFLWMIKPMISEELQNWLPCLKFALFSSIVTLSPFPIPVLINGEVHNGLRIIQGFCWFVFYIIVFKQGIVTRRKKGKKGIF